MEGHEHTQAHPLLHLFMLPKLKPTSSGTQSRHPSARTHLQRHECAVHGLGGNGEVTIGVHIQGVALIHTKGQGHAHVRDGDVHLSDGPRGWAATRVVLEHKGRQTGGVCGHQRTGGLWGTNGGKPQSHATSYQHTPHTQLGQGVGPG
jgi:hypothetical protein